VTYRLTFEERVAYVHALHSLSVPLRILPLTGAPFTVNAILDTGAAMSTLDRALAARLGIADVTSGTPTPVRLPDSSYADAFSHDVTVELFGRRLLLPALMCPSWPEGTENLLGMKGFFEQILFGLNHAERAFYYTAP
jgi:Aspartyl protease